MKAIEFQSELSPNRTLSVPSDVVDQIPPGKRFRVLVLLQDNADEEAWERLAAMDFGRGYADSDAIYDQLSNR